MRKLDCLAQEAALDESKLDRLIVENEQFILKCSSLIAHRYITKSDDEWSVALTAFAEAVSKYRFDKGSFLFFAETVIRRRLIDYQRNKGKYSKEIPVNPTAFGADEDEEELSGSVRKAVARLAVQDTESAVKMEIEAAGRVFRQYGFTFMDLSECSPRSKKTKSVCAKAVKYILGNPLLLSEMKTSKQLPLKIIEKNLNIPRKKLERHRKYIIAAAEILSGEYPCLSDYMQYIKEESDT
ncbi:MAG: RNA polymerase sigma factor SigI [Firmicutes bacterium ADurb.Bin182]|nr:MAG: RNA polymerase sigma factor SigI [Firmicutes bacterium ADurb.Bin182]